jgi:L-ribulose-5-phosphate 4-epimerase
MKDFFQEREKLLKYIQRGCEDGLIRLSSGNFSTRISDNLAAITPSGVLYQSMSVDDISIVDLEGNSVSGPPPSSETPMHMAIYREVARVSSICHTHSVYAMVCAMLGDEIPLMSIELMVCGAPIPVASWATPGTRLAGEVAVKTFLSREDLQVMLLRQHGLLAVGRDLEQAYTMAVNAETGMEVYYKTSLLGEAKSFTPEQIKEIQEVYGL